MLSLTSSAQPKVVLMLCGSFSPPTLMHFRMFEIARDYFKAIESHEVIGGVVSPTHDSYGKKGLVDGIHRFKMLKIGLRSSNWIKPSDWEINQDQWSRTKLVLEYHQNCLNNFINSQNNNPDESCPKWFPPKSLLRNDMIKVKLLCGADLLESFAVPGLWKEEDIEDILVNHGIVVITRSGSNPEKFIFESDILSKYRVSYDLSTPREKNSKFNYAMVTTANTMKMKHIILVTNFVSNEVSSTKIRTILRRGESVKYLLDDSVIQYIEKWGLYKSTTTFNKRKPLHSNEKNNVYLVLNRSESMDESDNSVPLTPSPSFKAKDTFVSVISKTNGNVFCCGPTEEKKKTPGKAIKLFVEDTRKVSSKKLKTNE